MATQEQSGDFTQPTTVLGELLDDDQSVRLLFDRHFHEDLQRIAANVSAAYAAWLDLMTVAQANSSNQQPAIVAAITIGVIDQVVVSTKLLMSGKFFAAGNLMRTVIEGIAFACLCATPKLVYIKKQRKADQDKHLCFWRGFVNGESYARGHLVLGHLERNLANLGLNADGVAGLMKSWKQRHQFSHAGPFATTGTFTLTGQVIIGGHFDEEKIPGYRLELADRIGLTRQLPQLIKRYANDLS